MKKQILTFTLVAFALFSQIFLNAQNNYTILENSKEKIRIVLNANPLNSIDVKTDQGSFSRIFMDNFLSTVSVGNPELPLFVCQLEIPICESVKMRITPGNYTTYSSQQLGVNYTVFPAQPSYSKSYEGPISLVLNSETYGENAFYAQALAQITQKGIFRSVNIAELNFSPVQYNPVSREFKIYESVEVEITFINPNFTETQRVKDLYDNNLFGFVSKNLINAQDERLRNEMNVPIKMAIVAHSSFRGDLDEYVAWKKRKGFLVDIVYTDDANVGTTTTSIKNYLQGLYDNATPANPAPTFLLLVGDVAQIPTFSGQSDSHYTDLYYATYTSGDHYPDCIYGRFSATSLDQLTPQIEKTLMYEQYSMENTSYLNDAVLVAGTDANWAPTHANGQMNYIANNYINTANGYANVYLHLYPASSQTAQIHSELGAGVGIANYSAHCGVDGWSDPSFSNSDVANMNNAGKYGLMIGNCCQSNTFYSTCLGEVLLRTPNKGAVGYIGATNYSYWDEDYYWGVGVRSNISSNPTYLASALGAYDRLFHTHNEDHSVWNVTNGGINLAGNWAVDNSSSSLDLYYWEVYHLMGDPSIMTYLTEPEVLTASAPSALMIGNNSLTVTTEPYAYVALTYNNELIAAAFANNTGTASLTFDPLSTPGMYEIAVWAQNHIQYFEEINVIVPSGSYVIASNAWVNESTVAANNAHIDLDCIVENLGVADASSVSVTATTTSPSITLLDDTLYVGNILQGQIITCSSAFSAQIANNVEDGTNAQITLNVTSDNNSATKILNINLKAPKLSVSDISMETTSGSEECHAGDTVVVTIENTNIGHNAAMDAVAILSSFYSGVTVLAPTYSCPPIAANASVSASFQVVLDNNVADGTLISLPYTIVCGSYSATANVFINVGASAMEDFETGDFSAFNWNQNNNPWITVTSNVYAGTYSAKSKTSLANYGTSSLAITLNALVAGNISYYRKVSSEINYDFFTFSIDGTEMESLSGTIGWGLSSFPVEAGQHTYTFKYEKDQSSSSGNDCAWIDNITFPPYGTPIENDIAQLNVTNHTVSNVTYVEEEIIPYNEEITVTFNIENEDAIAAQNVVAVLTSEALNEGEGNVVINNNTNNIANVAANGSTTTAFNLSVTPSRATDFRYINFNLTLYYNGTAVVYPFTLSFEGRSVASIKENQSEINCTLSPNPVENHLKISANEPLNSYKIYDMNGKLVKTKAISGNETTINVASLANGIYSVVITTENNQIATRKFIKE